MNEKVIQKLKKLLALAEDNGATESEAETAMRLAQELLVKHNLSMEDLQGSENDTNIIESIEDESSPSQWKHMIWSNTARLYFCRHLYSGFVYRKRVRHFVVGRPENVETTKCMARYFIKTIQKLAKQNRYCQLAGREYTKTFFLGCASRLCHRMEALRDSLKR